MEIGIDHLDSWIPENGQSLPVTEFHWKLNSQRIQLNLNFLYFTAKDLRTSKHVYNMSFRGSVWTHSDIDKHTSNVTDAFLSTQHMSIVINNLSDF